MQHQSFFETFFREDGYIPASLVCPVGVAAIFYSMDFITDTHCELVWELASFVVFFSTLVYRVIGLTLPKWYYKNSP
jgi:hypothetical protein